MNKRVLIVIGMLAAFFLVTGESFAATATPLGKGAGLAAVGQSVGTIGEQWGTGLQYIALAVGIGLGIFGLLSIIQAKKTQQPIGPGLTMVVIAILLTSLVGFLQAGSESIFGREQTAKFFETIGK